MFLLPRGMSRSLLHRCQAESYISGYMTSSNAAALRNESDSVLLYVPPESVKTNRPNMSYSLNGRSINLHGLQLCSPALVVIAVCVPY